MDQLYTTVALPLMLLVGQTLVALGQRRLNMRMDEGEAKRNDAKADTDAKRAAEAEWRDSVDQKLEELAKGMSDVDNKVNRQIAIQAADTRSDIIHKCHRYLDDLGCASTEEKNALADEHKQYTEFCEDLDIDNNFIDLLVEKVMQLPGRDV